MTDKQAIKIIDELVSGDVGFEADCLALHPELPISQDLAKAMADVLGKIYLITHHTNPERTCCFDRSYQLPTQRGR